MDWNTIKDFFTTAGIDLLRGLVALAVGLCFVHWVMKFITRYESKLKIEPTVKGFIKSLIRIILYIVVIMTAANTMGVPMTSVITLLGSAGVAVSLAMQGVLGNLIGVDINGIFHPLVLKNLGGDGCLSRTVWSGNDNEDGFVNSGYHAEVIFWASCRICSKKR